MDNRSLFSQPRNLFQPPHVIGHARFMAGSREATCEFARSVVHVVQRDHRLG